MSNSWKLTSNPKTKVHCSYLKLGTDTYPIQPSECGWLLPSGKIGIQLQSISLARQDIFDFWHIQPNKSVSVRQFLAPTGHCSCRVSHINFILPVRQP